MKSKNVLVVSIAAVLVAVIAVYEIWLLINNEMSKTWMQVEGKVVNAVWKPKDYRVAYEYFIEGKKYSDSMISYIRIGSELKEEKYKLGDGIIVFVNPSDHTESVLEPVDEIPVAHYSSTLFSIIAIILVMLGMIFGRKIKKSG